jgi:hypothetical protein
LYNGCAAFIHFERKPIFQIYSTKRGVIVNKNSIVSLTLACAALAGVICPASITSPLTGKLGGDVAVAETNLKFYFEPNPSTRFQIYQINGLAPQDALATQIPAGSNVVITFYTPYQRFQARQSGSSQPIRILAYDQSGVLRAEWTVSSAYSESQQQLTAESQKMNFLMQAINTTINALSQAMEKAG